MTCVLVLRKDPGGGGKGRGSWSPSKTRLVEPEFLDVDPTLQQEVMLQWSKGVEVGGERLENKAINVIGCLDRGQSENRRRLIKRALLRCPLVGGGWRSPAEG